MPADGDQTLYDRVGGEAFFRRLVDAFYEGVADDAALRLLYPDLGAADREGFAGARHRLRLFLMQYWGGPTTYNEERGHPRLRMRHNAFVVGVRERDQWLHHMTAAVDAALAESGFDDDDRAATRAELLGYFGNAAEHLRNDTGLPITSAKFRKTEP